jgi:chromatin remodeling complex protein RSC6
MNPQMQNYQRYAQAQAQRAPTSGRRPGECDSSTVVPSMNGTYGNSTGLIAPGLVGPGLPVPFDTTSLPVAPQQRLHDYHAITSFNAHQPPHGVWKNNTPLSSENGSHQRKYRKILPSPARTPRLDYDRTPSRTPSISPEKDIQLPDSPTPSRGRYLHFDNPTAVPVAAHHLGLHLQQESPSALSPLSYRRARLQKDMADSRFRNHLRLGYPSLPLNTSLHFVNAVPNQHANIAAQQHQQQLYQQQMAQRNAALEHQLAQRRAKKPTDLNLPEGLEDIVIGDGVQQYKALREAEKRLDYTVMRKRLDIQDTLNRNVRRQKTMRIWINNTCENQPWQRPPLDGDTFDFNTGEDSTFKLQIRGKLIDDDSDDSSDEEDMDEEDKAERVKRPKPAPKKFSHYFKGISVDYEIHQLNPNMPIDPAVKMDWKKTPQSYEFDMMEFNRKGDENQNITINLLRDEPVERYRLSTALANTLDIEEADRAEVVMGIWEYVKAMGLQEDDERRHVRCDERLKSVRIHSRQLHCNVLTCPRSSTPMHSSSLRSPSESCRTFTLFLPSSCHTLSALMKPSSLP